MANLALHSDLKCPVGDYNGPKRRKPPASIAQIREWIRLHEEMMGGMGDANSIDQLEQLKRDLRAAQRREQRRRAKLKKS